MRVVRTVLMVLLVVLIGGLAARAKQTPTSSAPPVYRYPEAAPGESAKLPRYWDGAPPLVPHSLDGLIPITREDNLCVFCHARDGAEPAGPPQIPKSHRTDYRRAPTVVRETVAGARWNCTACHVMQTNAPALVGNTFKAAGGK